MKPIIETHQLTKRFGAFVAAQDLNLRVEAGEIFGFLGANGAGKTTAMRMLCGLSMPSSGQATVVGFDVARQPEQVKRHIGYMSQGFSLYNDLTVWENIELFGGIYGLSRADWRQQGKHWIAQLQLEAQQQLRVGGLPLGWKQKLAFAIALLHRPALVFLDEPTGGVDPLTRRQFWDLLYQVAAEGVGILVTTHYMDEAAYCDRISMMVDGRIQAMGAPHELLQHYQVPDMDALFVQLASQAQRTAD